MKTTSSIKKIPRTKAKPPWNSKRLTH